MLFEEHEMLMTNDTRQLRLHSSVTLMACLSKRSKQMCGWDEWLVVKTGYKQDLIKFGGGFDCGKVSNSFTWNDWPDSIVYSLLANLSLAGYHAMVQGAADPTTTTSKAWFNMKLWPFNRDGFIFKTNRCQWQYPYIGIGFWNPWSTHKLVRLLPP